MSKALAATAVYVGSVVAANYVTTRFGLVAVGFGLSATAGTYFAGAALGVRDAIQDFGGRLFVLGAILSAAVVSYAVASPKIATASAAAFLLSELADLAVYSPLRKRGWVRAVVASNAVGAVVDTLLFLSLAGFGITGGVFAGQLVGKALWATLLFLGVGVLFRRVRRVLA